MASTAYASTRETLSAPYSAPNIPSASAWMPLLITSLLQPFASVCVAGILARENNDLTNLVQAYASAGHTALTGCNIQISTVPNEEAILRKFATRLLQESIETPREVSQAINVNLFKLL